MSIVILPLAGIPEVRPDDDLAAHLGAAIETSRYGLKDGDILVVCQKVVSKAEGRIVRLAEVEVTARAREFAATWDKDARLVELALREATEVRRMGDGHLITATGPGFVAANSGIDRSNQNAEGEVTLLPVDSDASAERLRRDLTERFGVDLGVLVTDTFGRPWRLGQVDFAIGAAGLKVLDDHSGRVDWSGRELEHTMTATADQLAAAAGLLMAKAGGVPVVIIRGFDWIAAEDTAASLVRPSEHDLFR